MSYIFHCSWRSSYLYGNINIGPGHCTTAHRAEPPKCALNTNHVVYLSSFSKNRPTGTCICNSQIGASLGNGFFEKQILFTFATMGTIVKNCNFMYFVTTQPYSVHACRDKHSKACTVRTALERHHTPTQGSQN